MTTVAALFAALPLMLGSRHRLGAARAAGHLDRRRPAGQPAADAVHHAGDLPVLRSAGRARAPAPCAPPRVGDAGFGARRDRRRRPLTRAMNIAAPFILRPVATTLLTIGLALAGGAGLFPAAGLADAQCRHADDRGLGGVAGRQPRDRGDQCHDAAGTAPGHHRRRDRDDLAERGGQFAHRAAVRAEPRHRWRGARRRGRDPGGARRSADLAAQQSELSQAQSVRCAGA